MSCLGIKVADSQQRVYQDVSACTWGLYARYFAAWFLVYCALATTVTAATAPDKSTTNVPPSVHVQVHQDPNTPEPQSFGQPPLKKELFEARIGSPAEKGRAQLKQELERLIALVGSIEFTTPDEATEQLAAVQPTAVPDEPERTRVVAIIEPGPNEPSRQKVTTGDGQD